MTLTGLVKDGVLRLVLNPDDEALDGWAQVALPEGVPAELLRWNGTAIVTDYSTIEAGLIARIDTDAEIQRCRFITAGAGQAMEYQEAAAQARACLAGDPGPFRMLEADVAAGTLDPRTQTAVTDVEEAADLVLWSYDQWDQIGSTIRTARLSAKTAVRAALAFGDTEAAIAAAGIDWGAVLP